ncbi:MAG: prepilin-type N-terminal cleavage/methylation domain-containing protein [Verrucomicrobiae bacterium]|nr:prepilin-type N-terminal cleavage/methylation domain-containing protein [Verrucomicrobiae bacterium]
MNTNTLRKFSQSAFTRTELLAVLAALGVIAMLVPAIFAWRRVEWDTQCKNNLRKLSGALQSYVQSSGEFPMFETWEVVDGKTNVWFWYYTLESKMVASDQHPPKRFAQRTLGDTPWDCPAFTHNRAVYLSYGYNTLGLVSASGQPPLGLGGKFLAPEQGRMSAVPVKEGDVVNPSSMLALGDGVAGWNERLVSCGILSRARFHEKALLSVPFNPSRHRGKINVAFVDGHVAALPITRLFSDTSDEALSMWNRDNQPHRERLYAEPVLRMGNLLELPRW